MKPLVLLSFSLAFLTHGFADDSFAAEPSQLVVDQQQPEVSMPMEPEESEWCLSPYHKFHASIRHNEANGIGYKDGYTTLEVFGIFDDFGSDFMPFFDVRGHVFNDKKWAGNVGIGERTLFESIDHIFGSYLYYDVRSVGHGLTVNQLSPGIELVGERMEYRINGYFPVGKRKSREYGFKFDKFSGNSIILKGKQQQAMTGFDAEVGVHLTQSTTYDFYAGAGPYYFHASHAHAWGGKVRLLGRYKEYVTLEVNYSYDHLFRNVVQGSIAFTLPFGEKLQRCGKCCPQTDNLLLSRAAFAPSRFEIPVVKRVNKREKAINPATGQPWVVWFVNNTSHSAGTFESPFPTLLQAQNASSPNNMIYVFSGDGTTNGMDAGITLQDGQSFFGSGIKQRFATTKGTKTIPAMSSANPTITNTGGDVVIIGNGNVVSGFNINPIAGSHGIFTPMPINGATVANNVFTVNADDIGVNVTGFGTFNIVNNQLTGSVAGVTSGIQIFAQGGFMSGMISNNSFSGFALPITVANASDVQQSYDLRVQDNTITGYSNAGIFTIISGASTVNIFNNTVMTDQDSATAIHVEDDVTTISGNIMISNNQVNAKAISDNGIQWMLSHANRSSWNVDISNNSVQGVGAGFKGISAVSAATDTGCLGVNNNKVVNPTAGSTAFNFDATAGTINIDSLQGNIGGPVVSTGNVNLVLPGTCGN